jgi:hypothetical protein
MVVRLDQLSRMQPAGPPPTIGKWFTVPTVPKPPSEQQLLDRLAERRLVLAKAYVRAVQVQDQVAARRAVVEHATRELDAARAALATIDAHDRRLQAEAEREIRAGRPVPDTRNGLDRQYVNDRVVVCETALAKFQRELADANASLADSLGYVRACATGVIAAILERETENLRALDLQAGLARAELVAVANWWPNQSTGAIQLSNVAGSYLADPPPAWQEQHLVRGGGGASRIRPWAALFDKLVAGDAEADFELGESG